MNIHEYQAKRLLAGFGVPVPDGRIAYTAEEAAAATHSLGGAAWFVKPQRFGAAESAISYVTTPEAAAAAAQRLLDQTTSETGARVTRVLVEEALPDAPALAVVFTIDGGAGRVACAVGTSAGANHPVGDRIDMDALAIDPAIGFSPHHARNLGHRLGLGGAQAAAFGRCLAAL